MKKILKYLKSYWGIILITVVLIFIQCMTQLKLPDYMSLIIDEGVTTGDVGRIMDIGVDMLLVTLLGTACAVGVSFFASRIGYGFGSDLRNAVFKKVEGFSMAQFGKFSTASLITRSTNDIQTVSNYAVMLLRVAVTAPITMIGGILMMLEKGREAAGMAVIFAVALPVLTIFVFALIGVTTKLFKSMQKKVDRLNLVMREGLTGVRVIRAFNKDKEQTRRFEEANADLTSVSLKANRLMSIMMPFMSLVMSGTQLAIVWLGASKIDAGALSIGNMMAFLQYAMQILMSYLMFGMVFMMAPRSSASAARINEILSSENTILDPKTALSPERLGSLKFEGVSFGYPGAEEPTLRDISFEVTKGQTLAIIGGTGSGKSTVANLMLRFFDVTEGRVLVDGVDVREMSQKDLHSRIGYVPQTAKIVAGTVRENIEFGSGDVGEEGVRAAAVMAQAEEFIISKEDGYDEQVSQGGTNLSGGQKQRLAIARAAARKPEFYLFDDSFSALDFKTDAALRAALKKNTSEATVVVIAQRINTIMGADRIIVLDEGRIVGDGNHEGLMQSCGVYREIASSQLETEAE